MLGAGSASWFVSAVGMTIGPVELGRPAWLLLLVLLWPVSVWLGRSSLTGMGTASRRVALAVRLLVIGMLVAALCEPSWRKRAQAVNVIAVLDESRSVPMSAQGQYRVYLDDAAGAARPGDTLAMVTSAEDAYVQQLPGDPRRRAESRFIGSTDGTNIGDAIRLAIAVAKKDAANRIVLFSDGNETIGSALEAARSAAALGIPIDIRPVEYRYEHEVLIDRLVAPATARLGETVEVRVIAQAQSPAVGRLTMSINGLPVDLNPGSDEFGVVVRLDEGVNPLSLPVTLPGVGPQRFDVVFEPLADERGFVADTILENNIASAVTFVTAEGSVLVVAPDGEYAEPIARVLREGRLAHEVVTPAGVPDSLLDMGRYDAIVLVNTPSWSLSRRQIQDLYNYVHDMGGGLVKIGGPDALGAGGWIGTVLEDALPVKLDPPQKRQRPKGALALIMHSCEMPQGNFWGKETALAAVSNLSRLDEVGVYEFDWRRGYISLHPMSPVGDGNAVRRAINSLSFGDSKDFDALMRQAIGDLEAVAAGQKHCIIISDGDPAPPSTATLNRYIAAGVSVSTVLVWPHDQSGTGPDAQRMRFIADQTGGRFYPILTQGDFATLPDIFAIEAQTIRRSLIQEGVNFSPDVVNPASEPMRGIRAPLPAITGYVVTAEREGSLAQVVLSGPENDPILAQWQHGLGKSVVFTSDLGTQWSPAWAGWGNFRTFWDQHIRWAMRPSGSADIRVITEDRGSTTRVIVEAIDSSTGERMNFLRWRGRAVRDGTGEASPIELRQTAPGRYEGDVDSSRPGAYVLSLRYAGPGVTGADGTPGELREGIVQAAFTRPFADEFRSLSDNSPLLRQIASVTGGRVLPDFGAEAGLWAREGLDMPVASTPVWLTVTMIAIGLFLADVGVRRVRLDPRAMAAAVRRGFGGQRAKSGEQLGSLREARERARESITSRTKPGAGSATSSSSSAAGSAPTSSGAKFDLSDQELREAGKPGEGFAGGSGDGQGGKSGKVQKAGPLDQQSAGSEADDGMSRLLRAKKRARGELDQDQ